jgi:hypothetical protein
MREHKHGHAPGRSPLVGHDDGIAQRSERAVGKTTRVAEMSGAADGAVASAAKAKHTDNDVDGEFRKALAKQNFVFEERVGAVQSLQTQLKEHPAPRSVDPNVLAHLAKVALGITGKSIQTKIASAVIKGAARLARNALKDNSSSHVKEAVFGGPIESFVQMQLLALREGKRDAEEALSDEQTDLLNKVEKSRTDGLSYDTAFDRARSLKDELGGLGDEAYMLQYNTSLTKWFSALAQNSFGKEPGGASDVDGHLSVNPVDVGGNKNYPTGYKGKSGFIHLQIQLSYKETMKVQEFKTEGLDPSVWLYRRKAGDTPLGDLPLNGLPGDQHIPVIADVNFILEAGSDGVEEHLPNRSTGENIQPVAISWNERDRVHTELPATDRFQRAIKGGDRTWLSQQVGDAVHKKDHGEAGAFIMREKIGPKSLNQLAEKPLLTKPK